MITLLFKLFRNLYGSVRKCANTICTRLLLYCNNVKFGKIDSNGIPFISVARGASCSIGDNFKMNNGLLGNPIGRPQKCVLFVDRNASIVIGNHVGISSTALVAHKSITIGNYVKIGGGVCIYDTDFHSLEASIRQNAAMDTKNTANVAVEIKDHVFIGAHTTILKGVIIGKNSIVGACSVVTKSIPANEIWAGNPAKFIKKVINNE
ncbi:acyltransferase [Polaribacter sp. Q13]|nr:acyltransferase [Polaribacter sp. Q13]